jgi:predicted lipoprotein
MNGAVRPFSRLAPAVRVALALVVPGVFVVSACRKAEPEEIVNGLQRGTGGFSVTEGSGGESSSDGSGGESASSSGGESTAGSGGAQGTPDASVSVGGDSGSVEPPPPDCIVPEIPTGVAFSKAALLEQAADCAVGRYCLFSVEAKRLRTATHDYASNASAANRTAMRTAWKDAMRLWQEAEQFRFGPAARSTHPGGANLRDIIYSWPAAARCKVDEQTLNRFYASADFDGTPTQSLPSGRSLAALEYLAFYERPDNGCNSFSAVNAPGAWPKLSPTDIASRRVAYARAVADDVVLHAEQLVEAWSENGGNFRQTWVTAGSGSATYASQQAALNSLTDALFYIENDLKDVKLALPMGLSVDCPAASCPDAAEAPYAKVSTDNLKQNIAGFRRLFQGCGENYDGIGFEDWLESPDVGRGDLAARIRTALDDVDAKLAALNGSIDAAVISQPDKLAALYAAVKGVTDPLKGEVVTVLNLELPGATEGDND